MNTGLIKQTQHENENKKPVSTYWEIELQGRYESEIENFHQQSGTIGVLFMIFLYGFQAV